MMPYVGPEPLNDRQRGILLRLVERGDAGISNAALDRATWSTLRCFRRPQRGLAEHVCDRDGDNRPIPGTWRWIATRAGKLEARRHQLQEGA